MPTSRKKPIPCRLRRIRQHRNMTLADVAGLTGYTAAHISGAELRKRRIGPRVVAALALAYGVTERTIREAAAEVL